MRITDTYLIHYMRKELPGPRPSSRRAFGDDDFLIPKVRTSVFTKQQQTYLHRAVKLPELDTLRSLIVRGADVNFQDKRGCTPLHVAVRNNNCAAVMLLLKHQAKLDIENKRGRTPFAEATLGNKLAISMVLARWVTYPQDYKFVCDLVAGIVSEEPRLSRVRANKDFLDNLRAHHFNALCANVDCRAFLHSDVPFILRFLRNCMLPSIHWTHCMTQVLNLRNISELFGAFFSYQRGSRCFCDLVQAFVRQDVPVPSRMYYIGIWIAFGAKPTFDDLVVCNDYLGFNDETRTLIQVFKLKQRSDEYDICQFLLDADYVRGLLKVIGIAGGTEKAKKVVTKYFRLFFTPYKSLADDIKGTPLDSPELVDVLKRQPAVPKLLEFSREAFWEAVEDKFEKFNNGVRTVLEDLNLPCQVRQIIMYERGIY